MSQLNRMIRPLKETLTTTGNRAEKATTGQSIKTHHSALMQNAQPTQCPPKVKKSSDRIKDYLFYI